MNITKYHQWTQDELDRMDDIEEYKYFVVHHTKSGDVDIDEIDRWHKDNGWVGVGYNYLIRADGSIEIGRPSNKAGAHAEGFNDVSVGVALTGNFTSDVPTDAQMDSLVDLLTVFSASHPAALVVKHSTLCATACPGNLFPWAEMQERLSAKKVAPVENWKAKLIEDAKAAGLIEEDHGPDEPAPKWFVLRVALAVLKGSNC